MIGIQEDEERWAVPSPKVFRSGGIRLETGKDEAQHTSNVESRRHGEVPEIKVNTDETQEDAVDGARKERRGFASMSPQKQREIASKGGRAAHEQGTAHEWTPDEARSAGRKGGQSSRGGRGRLIATSFGDLGSSGSAPTSGMGPGRAD
jgi:general stress protein YciG